MPYDPHLYFEGETTLALRTFTNGYDIFHIPKTPLFHCYVSETDQFKRPLHWHADEEKDRKLKWDVFHKKASHVSTISLKENFLAPMDLAQKERLRTTEIKWYRY